MQRVAADNYEPESLVIIDTSLGRARFGSAVAAGRNRCYVGKIRKKGVLQKSNTPFAYVVSLPQ